MTLTSTILHLKFVKRGLKSSPHKKKNSVSITLYGDGSLT